jgi:hypothetical protein
MASKASKTVRLRQNKGVKHGTIRTGAGGKSTRRYNSATGRWDVVSAKTGKGARSNKLAVKSAPKLPGAGTDRVNAASSSGSAWASNAAEGPRRSMARGSSLAAFANNPFGYLSSRSSASSSAVSTNRPSRGTPMRLAKSRNKTATGRSQYRWIKAR